MTHLLSCSLSSPREDGRACRLPAVAPSPEAMILGHRGRAVEGVVDGERYRHPGFNVGHIPHLARGRHDAAPPLRGRNGADVSHVPTPATTMVQLTGRPEPRYVIG
jgi:hypothetical protein